MIKRLLTLALPVFLVVAVAAPAKADRWHHGGHSSFNLSLGFYQPYPVYRPYYYAPYPAYYYAPPPVVYAPPPVVYSAPPVYAQPTMSAVPTRDFRDTSGRYCREYQRTAVVGGVEQQVYGTACMMPDGSWRIVSE